MENQSRTEDQSFDLLRQFEHILDSDPLIDELGFIHPTQLKSLIEEEEGRESSSSSSSSGVKDLKFWSRDHKLGISTQILYQLYKEARKAFFDVVVEYKKKLREDGEEEGGEVSEVEAVEMELMKHSKALVLLSSDYATAWNSRKQVGLRKGDLDLYTNELRLSALILSYAPKSEQAWGHRRWAIKMMVLKNINLQEIVDKESALVERIAERSKMNYRAWNHRSWLVSYMTREQVLHELKKTKTWAGLHVADYSCFHYRQRLMMRILEDICHEDVKISRDCFAESYEVWKEELNWDEILIKRYIGREALWLHRRFLSLCWLRNLHNQRCSLSNNFGHVTLGNPRSGTFLDGEIHLVSSCLSIPDNDYDDFQAQAVHSSTYILWLTKQISGSERVELQEKLRSMNLTVLLRRFCPERSFLVDFSMDFTEESDSAFGEVD